MKKIKSIYAGLAVAFVAMFAFVLSACGVLADTPTASSTLTTLMNSIIETSIGFATTVITTYWPYLIVFGILSAMIGLFMRFAHIGTGRGR